MKAAADLADELEIGEQQIDTNSDPDLSHDGVFGGAKKTLDLQVLLDPFEEQFDLPTGLVNRRDGAGREFEVVGQEDIMLAGLAIPEADTTQQDRARFCLGAGKLDGLIAGQPLGLEDRMTFNDPIHGIPALAGHEEDVVGIQLVIPAVIGIAAINDEDAALGQLQGTRGGDVMGLAIGDGHERRQQAAVIQADMQFDSALGGAEPGPGKDAETQIDGGGIQGIQFVLEPEAMTRCETLASGEQLGEQGFVK